MKNNLASENSRPLAHCAQCDSSLVVVKWSERLSERCVRYLWACDACDYEFETSVFYPADQRAA